MDELRESSLLFSLESLLETERQRVEREGREAEERRQHELKRVGELAERRRLAVQQEREARARRQLLEQERDRLDRERIETMHRATVERARIEAEAQARLVELEKLQEHERELSRMAARESHARYRVLFLLSAGLLLVTLAASVLTHFAFVQPAHARQQEHLKGLLGAVEARAAAIERVLTAERSKSLALEERLAVALSTAARTNATGVESTPLATARPPAKERARGLGPAKPCRDDGDPLDGCVR